MFTDKSRFYFPVFFLVVTIFCLLPVWWFRYYLNQDGSPHLYNAYLLLELLRGNSFFEGIYSINPFPIPNESGHWLLSLLLLIFPPFVASKIMVTVTFAGLTAACVWLRAQTAGREGITISFLLGSAFAFNWLWMLGFYNFILGLIGYAFTLGLFWKWRENLTWRKTIALSLLIVFVYFSHLISFAMLIGAMFLIALCSISTNRAKNLLLTAAAAAPSVPLLVGYKISTEAGGAIAPSWHFLDDPYSLQSWLLQIQIADPFLLISRKAFPFVQINTSAFALFSVIFWTFAVLIALAAGTYLHRKSRQTNVFAQTFPWLFITVSSVVLWIFLPDDFGRNHGGFLRERVLLCGLICFIPVYEIDRLRRLKIFCTVILTAVIGFQIAVLWEFSAANEKIAENYLAARSYITDDDRIASIVFLSEGCRFKADSVTNLNTMLGVGNRVRVWDNYEAGFYLFPVVVDDADERRFISEFRESNAIETCNPKEDVETRLASLQNALEAGHERISVLLVWNEDARLKPIINRWFEIEPFFYNDNIKLYRHKR